MIQTFGLKLVFKVVFITGLFALCQPCLNLSAQTLINEQEGAVLSASFAKTGVSLQGGQLSFNVIRIRNLSDSAVLIKPFLILPAGWAMISSHMNDTVIAAGDSILVPFRFRVPTQISAEIEYEAFFRAYSRRNELLAETSFHIQTEPFHDWILNIPSKRVFFYPRVNMTGVNLHVENKGNVTEEIRIAVEPDRRSSLAGKPNWEEGRVITLPPFQDTLLKVFVKYTDKQDRVFDITKLQVTASSDQKTVNRPVLIEKYNDVYAPLYIDRNLPHQVEAGIRTFSGNNEFLPFIKTRGMALFENGSMFRYNFNYYSQTGAEDFISNSYYNFTYNRRDFQAGIGAFSSQLGRNLYTRNGVMVSTGISLTPTFKLTAMISQSFFVPKTSAGVGYAFEGKKYNFTGSVAYDYDNDRKINTGSLIFQSGQIQFLKNHNINLNLYGFREQHYQNKEYTLQGVAWDVNYNVRIGNILAFKLTHNYGSPNVPGPQMGLLNFIANPIFYMQEGKNHISIKYINVSRVYSTYDFEGSKLPENRLYDQYANFMFHSGKNPKYAWEAGPSIEYYQSMRPSLNNSGHYVEFQSEKIRFEYKGTLAGNLTLGLKTGITSNRLIDVTEVREKKYDFHLAGGYSFFSGIGIAFSYDYGPMVNSGLYQFPGDVNNHSFSVGPTIMSTLFKNRLIFSMFTNFLYRIDLNYTSFNINPRVELYVFRDWYVVASGTYYYNAQDYGHFTSRNSHTYLEIAIKKNFGKTDYNKWQRGTRRLKIVIFRDDNGNGKKDDFERGVPYVKSRVRLTNSNAPEVSTRFPVDITLLTNQEGMATFNRLPMGFYELSITPMEDLQEYFYVDRSVEKIELTQNSTVYIPFQKASRITGQIDMKRQQFIKKGEETVDLKNIRVTAYNDQGNSYSSFTLPDGSFVIFVPNNNNYWVRINNVFGEGYSIHNNDMMIAVSDGTRSHVVLNVAEVSRQIRFKKAGDVDTTEATALKTKVLHGKFYENAPEQAVDKDAVPSFNIPVIPETEQALIPGRFYVVLNESQENDEALKYLKIVRENGINAYIGYHEPTETWYVFTNHYETRSEAQRETGQLKRPGLRDARVMRF